MSIYHYAPVIIVPIYFSLLLITMFNRPWLRQHKLFMLYLVATIGWSIADFLLRSQWFQADKLLLFRLVTITSMWWVLQLYYFSRGFLNLPRDSAVRLGYIMLAAYTALCLSGFIPPDVKVTNGQVSPVYGWWVLLWIVPMMYVGITGISSLVKRWISSTSPEERNKLAYLLSAVGLLAVFGFTSVTPLAYHAPIGHIGTLLAAMLLTFSVVRDDLISINVFLRRLLGWASIVTIGIAIYELLLVSGHFLVDLNLDAAAIIFLTSATILVTLLMYYIRPAFLKKIDQLFYRQRYEYRKQLLDYVAHEIRGVSSLQELSDGLLMPLVKTLDCQQAFMLLPEKRGESFVARFSYPSCNEDPQLFIRNGSPATNWLYRQYLTKKDLEIRPEFRGMWTSEKNGLADTNIELLFPLISRGTLVGILALSRKLHGSYSVEDANLVESITNTVAISIEKERYQSELAKREKELSLINRLTHVITSSLNINDVYDSFIQGLREVVNVDFAAIGVIRDDNLHLSAVYNKGGLSWNVGDSVQLRGSGLEWLVLDKKSIICPNAEKPNTGSVINLISESGNNSIVFLPLITKDEVIGILTLASHQSGAYDQNQIQLLEQLSFQISTSVVNSQLYSSAEQRARIDELTGMANRRHFDETIEKEIQRHLRYGTTLSLILTDIDNFKYYNDSLGHLSGDKLLRKVAQLIMKSTRDVDMSFRFGGDEFAVLLPSTSDENTLIVAERIRKNIELQMQGEKIPITASLGIASWPSDGITPQDLITAADQALYYAKRTGENRACTATQAIPSSEEQNSVKQEPAEKEILNTIYALAATIEARDRYTYGHSRKVRTYAVALAEAIKLPAEKVTVISHAALLHDIGKIGIYDTVLNKPGTLSSEERDLIKRHPELSRAIVAHLPKLTPCLPAILHHHERWDGQGYPQGLKGDNIPLEARILAIADSFDAMTSVRPYRCPLPTEKVIDELNGGAGTQFDASLIEVFLPIAIQKLNEAKALEIVSATHA